MKRIGIIGGGFSGTMTAVRLIEKSESPGEIILIDQQHSIHKGIAYNPYSGKHLLNVVTGKMSAYAEQPEHFLDWIMEREEFNDMERTWLSNAFLPRHLYGEYLGEILEKAKQKAIAKGIKLKIIDCYVTDLDVTEHAVILQLDKQSELKVNQCVLTTGNNIPRNPEIHTKTFYNSDKYFQNPWEKTVVKNIKNQFPILIIGNGLTMVDTVLGLLENGYNGTIYSISPNGFNILPHRHNGLKYTILIEESNEKMSLYEWVKLLNKHIKSVRKLGISAEPVIDSLRPHTQRIWRSLSDREKALFMKRLRHLWGVARHRIPLHIHDKIQQLRIDGKLHILSGKIIDCKESEVAVMVEFYDKKDEKTKSINVSRVINCTGPETDLMQIKNHYLMNCLLKGMLTQDKLKLGINTNTETFQVINADGQPHSRLFTIGSNLKGELWESTAVNELRIQADKLAEQLKFSEN